MLARYRIHRGKRPPGDPLPDGVRQDIRYRARRHPLHPPEALVKRFLANLDEKGWRDFRKAYLAELEQRFNTDRAPFDALAEQARTADVYIGCNCPTQANPRVDRCHTWPALEFMQQKYPRLKVVFPPLDT